MGNKTIVAGALLAGLLLPAAASAEGLPGEISGGVAFTSNYIYRGISQTDDGPAIQGNLDYTQDIFYMGAWGSSVDFGDDTTMELDLYAGLTPTINNLSFDIGVLYYDYPDSPPIATGDQNFLEIYGGVSAPVGPLELGVKVSYSPDFYGEIGDAFYYQLTAAIDLSEQTGIDGLSISGGYGLSRFDNDMLGDDYDDWNVGVSVTVVGLDLDLRYYDTTGLPGNDDAVVFTVSKSF